jgi:hypothetical protein
MQTMAAADRSDEAPSLLDRALALAAEGYPVFPLIPGGKIPAVKRWPERASTNPDAVRAMWAGREGCNIGIRTGVRPDGQCLLVLDVDVKEGAGGRQSLAMLSDLYEGEGSAPWLAGVKHVTTASGGDHYYFLSGQVLGSSASRLGPGLDTRGEVGYVVAAGSVVGDRAYVDRGGDLAPIPDWLAGQIGAPAGRRRTAQQGNVTWILDTQPSLERAEAYLRDEAEPSVEGAGGDANAYRVACRVKDFGVSELACLELMAEHWNERCAPPWEWGDLAVKVANAYAYGGSPPGILDPANYFDILPDPPAAESPAPGKRPRLHFKLMRDVAPKLDRIALIDQWLDRGVMSVLYGDSNVGKTFVALALSRCIAAGEPVAGRRVQQGGVVYVAAEAGASIERRVEALKRRYGRGDLPLAIVPCPVDLLSPDGDAAALAALVREAGQAMGVGVALVVIDTLSRAMQGGNENASEHMGAFVINVDKLRISTGAHVMIVHHSGKDKAKGARGHSLLRAATDTEIEVEAGQVKATKQRDLELPRPMPFRLESVEIGRDSEGETVTSAVALLGERPPSRVDFDVVKLTKMEALALDTLSEAIATRGFTIEDHAAASSEAWTDAFVKRQSEALDEVLTPETRKKWANVLRPHRNALRKKGVVACIEENQWVIEGA